MRRWMHFLGCSISLLITIACARSELEIVEMVHATSGGSTGGGGSAGNSLTCPRGYAGPACDTPVFVALALPANPESCRVDRISGDCSTAVGSCRFAEGYRAVKWDTATGAASILPSTANAFATGSNNDGSLIVGNMDLDESASSSIGVVWTSTEGDPATIDQSTYITAVSDDGRIVIGNTSEGAAYWDISNLFASGTAPHPIVGTTNTDWETSLSDLSSDGSIIVGTISKLPRRRASEEAAIRWTERTEPSPLVPTPDGDATNTNVRSSNAHAVSGDGKVTLGVLLGWNENTAVRWPSNGEQERLPPEDKDGLGPADANFDGSIIVGSDHGSIVLWDASGSMQLLDTMLARIGVTFPPKDAFATGICNDGTVLTGNFQDVSDGNTPIPWVVHLKGTGLLGL